MREQIIQRFKGDFAGYIPPLLGNGDIGGTFDPFCGTWFDELRSVPDQKEDVRTLLLARFIAQDYWRETGFGGCHAVTRGSPFAFYIGPADAAFPVEVSGHQQCLDIETGLLSSEYQFQGNRYRVECFVDQRRSFMMYRVEAGGPVEFRVQLGRENVSPEKEHQLELDGYGVENVWAYQNGGLLTIRSRSNVYCPGLAAVWSDRGAQQEGRVVLPPGVSILCLAYGHTALSDPDRQISENLEYAKMRGYDALRQDQIAWWSDFWSRSHIIPPDDRMRRLYDRSLYYIGVSLARKTKTPCFEAGISGSFPAFTTGYHIHDAGLHVLPMISSNHLELVEPMLDWFLDVLPVARENARSVYWLTGARYFWHGGPGMLPFIPGHTHYMSCAHEHHVNGWVALSIERYLSASGWDLDKTRRYYPVVAEMARFFSAMLLRKGNGYENPVHPRAKPRRGRVYRKQT